MILYHLSLEPVTEFIPRVPKGRAVGEDDRISRICVSDAIENCLNAMPGGCSSMLMLQEMGIIPALYVYEFRVWKNTKGLMKPKDLRDLVPDAEFTHEHWLTRITRQPKETIYQVSELSSHEVNDPNEMPLYPVRKLSLRRISDTENLLDNAAYVADTIPDLKHEFYTQVEQHGLNTVLQVWWEAKRLKDLKQNLTDS